VNEQEDGANFPSLTILKHSIRVKSAPSSTSTKFEEVEQEQNKQKEIRRRVSQLGASVRREWSPLLYPVLLGLQKVLLLHKYHLLLALAKLTFTDDCTLSIYEEGEEDSPSRTSTSTRTRTRASALKSVINCRRPSADAFRLSRL
jgi:hypothetical protein